MEIHNSFEMNDWEIKKFFKIIIAIQLAMLGTVGLDLMGIPVPILRHVIGFIYLVFVPGIIILRILKLHKLGNVETLLYTVGLSIATLMFTGLFMNTVYPFFGISGPISITHLVITISVVVLVLCILCYVRDKDFSNPSLIDLREVLSPPVLFLCLIPFMAVLGTYLVNFHHNNILLMLLIVAIALIAVLIGFDKFIPKNLYPLAVFVITISLLYHNSLISMYIWGWDIQLEYYLANLVMENSYWDSTIPRTYNTMLSITMLAPMFSNICGMSLTEVFKIIYPLLFSLAPLGLYRVFQKQTDDKIAFLSCFFFISIFVFYTEMLQLARQEIAELFLVLLIMAMIDKNMGKLKRSFLFIVFGVSLAVSHYALSYIYMFCLSSAWVILVLAENLEIEKLRDNFYSKFGRKREKPAGNPIFLKAEDRTISLTFVLLFITFTLAWYMHVSSSSAFDSIVRIGDHIASSIFSDFLNPEAAQGAHIILRKPESLPHNVNKYLHLITQFFILAGVITLVLSRKRMAFEREYEAFSFVNFMICFAGIAVPYFASSLNTTRLYQITLIFLAPFCVIGGITIFKVLSRVVKVSWTNESIKRSLHVLSVYFVIFLLFNTGFVYEVAKDHPTSISLSSRDLSCSTDQEVLAGNWLKDRKDMRTNVYSDVYVGLLLLRLLGISHYFKGDENTTTCIPRSAYIFFGRENVKNKKIVIYPLNPISQKCKIVDLQNLTFYNTLLNMSEIYTNGGAQVYYR